MRAARPADIPMLLPLIQAGYPGQELGEQDVEQWLAMAGIHLVDAPPPDFIVRAYVHLTINELFDPIGPVPAGLTTHISSLLPQHHDPEWVDDVLFPLLISAIRKRGRENAHMLDFPLYGVLPKTLIPYWEGKLGSIAFGEKGSRMIYVATLREAIRGI